MFYFTPYVILPLLSAAVNGLLGLYVWQRRTAPAARPLIWIMISLSGWSLAYAVNTAATSLAVKIFCYQLATTFACIAAPALLVLALTCAGLDGWVTRRRLILVSILPAISVLGAWTSELHSLHRFGFHLYESGPLLLLGFQEGPLFKMHVLYILVIDCVSIAILTSGIFRYPKSEWPRFALLIIAVLIPMAMEFLFITPQKGFALTSSSFFLSGILFTSAIFLYRLLDLLPLARTALFDQIGEPVLVYDDQGVLIASNASAVKLLGYDIHVGAKRRFPALEQAFVRAGGVDIDYLADSIETQRHWRVTASVLKAGVISGTLLFLHDITSLKQTEAKLKNSEEKLKSWNMSLQKRVDEEMSRRMVHEHLLANSSRLAAMGQMINAIAHQWRQPLSTLAMIIQRTHAMGTMKQLTREQLDEMKSASLQQITHMSDTIEEFRNFYRPEKKKETFLPHLSVASAIRLFDRQFTNSTIAVELSCREDARQHITGYPNEFKQVILNLLSNARDAIVGSRSTCGRPENGHIRVDISVNGRILVIDVTDNAGGIADNIANQIFDPFFTTKEKEGGTGIGLYISRMIVEDSMKGRIQLLTGSPGATFRVELPIGEEP